MKEKVNILYFVDYMLRGGIQSLVIDWVSRFDKKKIQVDILLLDDGNKYELEEKLKELGCNVYKLDGIWINNISDYFKQAKALDHFFKEHHNYQVLHMHSTSKNFLVLKYAQKYSIKTRIIHSHNINFQTKNIIKKMMGNVLKIPMKKYSTDYFACSKIAGEWLFGKKIVNSNKFKVIHNAVDYEKFKFNKKYRETIRKEFGIDENTILIGNVGRLENQKNHKFLINIFYEYKKINNDSKLILVGIGSLEQDLKEQIKVLKLEKDVIFAGFRNDVYKIIQAFDLFLMPSINEGLPVVGVEAQASGLPVVVSKKVVTEELNISNNVTYISLSKKAEEWAKIIYTLDLKRKDNYSIMKKKQYFIDDIIKELETIYLK